MKTLLTAITLTLAGALATAAPAPAPLPALERVMVIEPRAVGDLAMKDQDGKPRRLADLTGAPALVFFGFTHCPDVCPTTLQKLAMIKSAKAKEMAGVRVVLVSVDGERDTPEVLEKFLERFDKDFVGLTAPSAEVRGHGRAHTVELNLEPSEGTSMFAEARLGAATELVPAFVRELIGT